jgi:phage anti-repressor protein
MSEKIIHVFAHPVSGDELCDALALHEHLNIGRVFVSWIKSRIAEYGFVEGEDFFVDLDAGATAELDERTWGGKRREAKYSLTLEMAKELSMIENNEQGRAARRYFIMVEKEYKALLKRRIEEAEARESSLAQSVDDAKAEAERFKVLANHVLPFYSDDMAKRARNKMTLGDYTKVHTFANKMLDSLLRAESVGEQKHYYYKLFQYNDLAGHPTPPLEEIIDSGYKIPFRYPVMSDED